MTSINSEENSEGSFFSQSRDWRVIHSLFHSGAYSVVVEARNLKTGDTVAVKCIDLTVLEAQATPGIDPLLPLKREIKIMKKVTHDNVIRLYEVFVDDEKFYMVMEL